MSQSFNAAFCLIGIYKRFYWAVERRAKLLSSGVENLEKGLAGYDVSEREPQAANWLDLIHASADPSAKGATFMLECALKLFGLNELEKMKLA